MAEIVVPAVGLGLLWIISNQNKEGYENRENEVKKLPNTNLLPENFPIDGPSKLDNLFKNKIVKDNLRKYHSGKEASKKYFTKEFQANENLKNYKNQDFQSLTGETVNASNLNHNNMVPWFGSKVRQPVESNRARENLLDSYTGSGSQHFEKQVQAPLFKPQKDMTWNAGMPNHNDFIQSRMNPSQKISGVKPFEEVHVAPGLNQGYNSEGFGGYNAGMVARDRWQPKTVDELRTSTNPKLSFQGQFLGPKAAVTNLGIQGKVEKQRPDTYWESSPDKWFTTVGLEKGQTSRAQEVFRPENRSTTGREYYGAGGDVNHNAVYTNRNYQEDHRQDLPTNPVGPASRPNVWDDDKNDYGREGFVALPNSRTLTGETNSMGNIGRGMWAAVTPVLDMLRPSRKSNIIGNMRPVGNATGPQQQKLYNRNQEPKSTIKEQYVENKYIPMGVHAHDGGYATQEIQMKPQQRASTQQRYVPNASASSQYNRPQNYDAYENQRTNDKDLLSVSRTNPGNMKLVNGNIKMCNRKDPLICAEPFRPPSMPTSAPTVAAMGQQSYKITRGHFGNHDRTESHLVSALNSNPYAKPLGSVA